MSIYISESSQSEDDRPPFKRYKEEKYEVFEDDVFDEEYAKPNATFFLKPWSNNKSVKKLSFKSKKRIELQEFLKKDKERKSCVNNLREIISSLLNVLDGISQLNTELYGEEGINVSEVNYAYKNTYISASKIARQYYEKHLEKCKQELEIDLKKCKKEKERAERDLSFFEIFLRFLKKEKCIKDIKNKKKEKLKILEKILTLISQPQFSQFFVSRQTRYKNIFDDLKTDNDFVNCLQVCQEKKANLEENLQEYKSEYKEIKCFFEFHNKIKEVEEILKAICDLIFEGNLGNTYTSSYKEMKKKYDNFTSFLETWENDKVETLQKCQKKVESIKSYLEHLKNLKKMFEDEVAQRKLECFKQLEEYYYTAEDKIKKLKLTMSKLFEKEYFETLIDPLKKHLGDPPKLNDFKIYLNKCLSEKKSVEYILNEIEKLKSKCEVRKDKLKKRIEVNLFFATNYVRLLSEDTKKKSIFLTLQNCIKKMEAFKKRCEKESCNFLKTFELSQKEFDCFEKTRIELEYTDKKKCERFSSFIVSNLETDITTGFRNFFRISLVVSEIEWKIRRNLVGYLKDIVKKTWSTLIKSMQVTSSKKVNELMGHTENFNYCIEKKHFDENYKNFMERQMLMMVDNLNEQDLATLFKIFLSSNKFAHIKDVSHLDHLDLDTDLEIQSIQYIYSFLKPKIKEDLGNNELCDSLDKFLISSFKLRNRVCHDVLIVNEVFNEYKDSFLENLQKFKSEIRRSNTENEYIKDFANEVEYETFKNIFVNPNPETRVSDLSGIQFILPVENRKRGKTPGERDGNEICLVDFLKYMVSHKNPQECLGYFFNEFPDLKDAFYEGYEPVDQ